jgi:hypothetical protein
LRGGGAGLGETIAALIAEAILAGLVLSCGALLCCTIPAESGGRGWAVALTSLLTGLAVLVVGQVAMMMVGPALLVGGLATSFAASLCFFMVLRAAARYWDDPGLGAGFLGFFVVISVVSAAFAALNALVAAGTPGGSKTIIHDVPPVLVIFGCGLSILLVIADVCLLAMLSRLRVLIPPARAGRPHQDAE